MPSSMRNFQTARIFMFLIVASIAVAVPVWAYIPPASFILHTIAKKHTSFSSIRVRSSVFGVDGNGVPTTPKLRETTIFNSREQSLRSWMSDETGKVLYVTERRVGTGPTGKMSVIPEILFDTNSVRMANALKAAGIQLPQGGDRDAGSGDKLTLRRWNRTVAWVLGKSAQLWIEKDTFVPLRVIAPATSNSDLFDFQMENFRFYDEFPYPRLATLHEAGKKVPILKAELIDAVLDPASTPIDMPKEKVEGMTDAGLSSSSQVRDLIQTYYRFIR